MAPPQDTNTATEAPPASYIVSNSASGEELRLVIRQYRPEDHAAVAKLVGDGLMTYAQEPFVDFWTNYVKNALKTDIADIPGRYLSEGSTFFVAITADTGATSADVSVNIVGTLALEKQSDTHVTLRRLSVKSEFRRFGVGRVLMRHATAWAKAPPRRYAALVLWCASTQLQAIRFYESLGFALVKTTERLADPYLELHHFEKQLGGDDGDT